MFIKDLPLLSVLGDAFKIPISDITSDRALAVTLKQVADFASQFEIITYEDFKAIETKEQRLYFVAENTAQKEKGKFWRIYIKSTPFIERTDTGYQLCSKFCFKFPFKFV